MKFWIARDKDGELYLYEEHPKKRSEFFGAEFGCSFMQLDGSLFPEVTWGNSPQEVELKLISNGISNKQSNRVV